MANPTLERAARLLDGDSFRHREEGLERVDQMRRGPRGNDPDYHKVIGIHDRIARMSPERALTHELALKIEAAFGVSAELLTNIQNSYALDRAKLARLAGQKAGGE